MQNRQPSVTTSVCPITSVIGPSYCDSYPVQLEIVKTVNRISDEISVKDDIGNTVFNLERRSFSAHKRCILLDPAGNPIVTLRRKIITAHNRWQVFRGNSDQKHDLLFDVKRPDLFHRSTKLDVFLATNSEENVCDFKVESSSDGSCVVSAVQSSNIVAKMLKYTAQGMESEKVQVRVETNVDYAFIVALAVILSLE